MGGSYSSAQELLLQTSSSQELLNGLQAGRNLTSLEIKSFADDLENMRNEGAERVRISPRIEIFLHRLSISLGHLIEHDQD